MRKVLVLIPLLACCLACPKSNLEGNARDAAATLGGLVTSAQAQHQECVTDSSPTVCQTIKRGISGQNALITSLETYCEWAVVDAPPPTGTPCTPVSTAEGALQAAISNANQLTTEVKGVVKP